jgi:hypothetical protein
MSVAFKRGSTTYPDDLNITIRDCSGNLIDPYRLQYAVYDKTTGVEVLQGSPVCTPIKINTGKYYAQVVFPADCNIGDWVIRWTVQETSVDPVYQTVQDFNVVGDSTIVSFTGDPDMDKLIYSLRIMLRDQNPDRNYRTRSPESEKFIQGMTQVFGFIWEDEEMNEYIYMACDAFNAVPPVTGISPSDLWNKMRRWRTAILLNASAIACRALSVNWIADEFSFSGDELIRIKDKDGVEYAITAVELLEILYGEKIAAAEKEGKKEALEGIKELENEKEI